MDKFLVDLLARFWQNPCMARQPVRELVDRLLEGRLNERLVEWRELGLNADAVTAELQRLDVPVSRETVRIWLKELEPAA